MHKVPCCEVLAPEHALARGQPRWSITATFFEEKHPCTIALDPAFARVRTASIFLEVRPRRDVRRGSLWAVPRSSRSPQDDDRGHGQQWWRVWQRSPHLFRRITSGRCRRTSAGPHPPAVPHWPHSTHLAFPFPMRRIPPCRRRSARPLRLIVKPTFGATRCGAVFQRLRQRPADLHAVTIGLAGVRGQRLHGNRHAGEFGGFDS